MIEREEYEAGLERAKEQDMREKVSADLAQSWGIELAENQGIEAAKMAGETFVLNNAEYE